VSGELVGIPGTVSEETRGIRWFLRKDKAPLGGKAYQAQVADGWLVALVTRDEAGENGRKLWHISVSHRNHDNEPDRCPTFDELKHAAYRLVQAEVCWVLIFPRRTTPTDHYVNLHETCLHLWEDEHGLDK